MAETQNSKQNVQAPQAGQTVIVNAIPGQDIMLEAAFDQADVKMDSGNVIFEFANGGQVVLNFSDIGEAQAPNVVMPDGTVLDMQEFLVAMGEKEIEPAAGPEAGADGSGGVGEYREGAGDLLDSVEKLGGLEDDPFPAFTLASIEASDDNPLPTAGIVGGAVDEDGLRLSEGAHFDGNDDEVGGDNPARFSYLDGILNYDFGGDGPAGTNPFVWGLVGLPVVFSEGNQLVYEVVDGGLTLNAYYITEGYTPPPPIEDNEENSDFFSARISEAGPVRVDVFSLKLTNLDDGTFRFELYQPLDHSDTTTEDDINYGFTFTLTDGSGDTAVGGLNLAIDDDSPIVTADATELPTLVLDETALSDGSLVPTTGGNNVRTASMGDESLSITVDFSGQFTALYGADGPAKGGSGVVESPQMTGNNNFANAISLDGHFTLGSNPDVGNSETTPFVSVSGVGNGQPDYFVFTVKAANTTAVFDIDYGKNFGGDFDPYLHLWNSAGERLRYNDDGNIFDSGSFDEWDSYLTYTFTEPGTYYISVGRWPGAAPEDANNPIPVGGTYQLQVSLPGAIAAMAYELSLEGDDMGSGLYALDATDTATDDGDGYGKGSEIMLSMGEDGRIVGTVGDAEFFSIRVNAATGEVTFEQVENVWHADTDDHDDSAWLNAVAGTIRLTATATDGDGDSESAFLDLSSGVFAIEDDGPSIVGELMTAYVDEANIDTPYSDGTGSGDGPAIVSGSLASLVDFGTDGMGSFGFASAALQKLYSTDFWWGVAVPVQLKYAINVDAENNTATLVATEPDMRGDFKNSSNVVFEFELNTETGDYKFLLHDELRHFESPGETITLNFGALIEAVDRDGDSVSLNGSFEVKVEDDVPSPVINPTGVGIVHDETPGVQSTSDDVNSSDVSEKFDGVDFLWFGKVGGVINPGNDNDVPPVQGAIGFAKSDGPVVSTEGSKAGADHLDDDNLSLVVLAEDGKSHLTTTEGFAIELGVDTSGRIIGRVVDPNEGALNGKAAFAIALGTDGTLYTAQYLSLYHDDFNNSNDIVDLAGEIGVVYTMKDTDGDIRSTLPVDVGAAVVFADDGPKVEVVTSSDPANLLVLSNFDFASSAGHHNSYGYYIKDGATGEPDTGVVVWNDVHDYGQEPSTITVSGYTQDQIGFFIISNGGNINSALSDNAKVVFDKVDGKWQAFLDDGAGGKGTPLGGFGSPVIFDEPSLNADGRDYMMDKPGTAGNQNWEDLPLSGPDADFNDVNINAQWTQASNGLLVVDESNFDINATLDLSGAFKVNYGADGPGGALTYAFDLKDGASGLKDTATDRDVQLRFVQNDTQEQGYDSTQVQGYIDEDGVERVVFEMSVDGNGVVTLDQQRAVVHDDAKDPIEALDSAARINSGLISLVATAIDGDHDTHSASLDVGQMVRFEDDGPSAANAGIRVVEQIPVHVSGFQAGFVSALPDGKVVDSPTTLDADPLADAYYWGGNSDTGSGYKFVDNEALRGVSANLAGSAFKLGTFSHLNRPIESGSSVTSVDLRVKFMVNGESVVHTITLDHDETTNTNNDNESKDGIEINSASFNKVFSVAGQQFELKILGFVNSDGTIVTSISTFEDNVNLPGGPENFSLMASISPVTAPVIEGDVHPDFGADGRGEVIWGGEFHNGADGTDDYYVTETQYGTFTGYADGSYKFVRSSFDVNEPHKLDFGYKVVDGDGDTASAKLSLTITDSSEVTAVDDIIDARPVVTETSDAVTHTVVIPESVSVSPLSGGFEVDPAKYSYAKNASGFFSTSGALKVVFDLHVQGFRDGDAGKVYLQKWIGNQWYTVKKVADIDFNSVNDIEFDIGNSGTYRLFGEGWDWSKNGDFKFDVKDIEGKTIVPAQTLTDNQYFIDVDWNAASQKTGNVLSNDIQGVEGALVAEVDNNDVHFGGTVIEGTYGSLTIHPDGAYSYTPNYAPDDTDYIGGTLTESFAYKLVQPDGDFDTATLTFDVTPQLPVNAIEADASHVAQGSDQADFIFGTSGDDTLSGLAGNDYINGGSGDDSILGGDGNDHLIGAAGDDTLVGGDGDDLLTGGAGDDSMTGGAGEDVFKYVDGDLADVDAGDIIADFDYQQDHLDLSELLDGATVGNLGGYLRVDSFSATQIELSVDADGGGDDWTKLATINIINMDSSIDQSNVLTDMINDGVLKIG